MVKLGKPQGEIATTFGLAPLQASVSFSVLWGKELRAPLPVVIVLTCFIRVKIVLGKNSLVYSLTFYWFCVQVPFGVPDVRARFLFQV